MREALLQASPKILPERFSIIWDKCDLKGGDLIGSPMKEALSFPEQVLANVVRQGLKRLDQQLCLGCAALDLPDSTHKTINQKSRKYHRVAWEDKWAIGVSNDALAVIMGKDKVVKIWQEAYRRGHIRWWQWSTWHIEEFSSLLVSEGHQLCSKCIDSTRKSGQSEEHTSEL